MGSLISSVCITTDGPIPANLEHQQTVNIFLSLALYIWRCNESCMQGPLHQDRQARLKPSVWSLLQMESHILSLDNACRYVRIPKLLIIHFQVPPFDYFKNPKSHLCKKRYISEWLWLVMLFVQNTTGDLWSFPCRGKSKKGRIKCCNDRYVESSNQCPLKMETERWPQLLWLSVPISKFQCGGYHKDHRHKGTFGSPLLYSIFME